MNYQNGGYPPQGYPLPGYPPSKNPWRLPIRRTANIVCFGLTLVVLLGIFLTPVFTAVSDFIIYKLGILSRTAISSIDMFTELFVYVLMFLIPIIIIRLWIGIPSRIAFPMRKTRGEITFPAVFAGLGMSVIGMLTYGILTLFLEQLFGVTPYMPEIPLPVGIFATAIYFLRMTVVPAIFEELMFRGVIMQSLRRFGDFFALICSSILFALAHHNLVQGPNALLVGLVIGFFVLRLGSLRVGILMHFVNNALAVIVELSTRNLTDEMVGVVSLLVILFYAGAGIIAFSYLVSVHGGMFRLAASDYPVSGGAKYRTFFLTVLPVIYIAGVVFLTCLQFR